MSENLSELLGRKGLRENLFEQLGRAARETGTPDPAELDRLADAFLVGTANTYGAATFYDFLKPENKGKQAYVCNGTACTCAGTQEAVHEKLAVHLGAEQIGHMTCLGRCHENAAFHYNGRNYSGADIDNLPELLKGTKQPGPDRYHVGASHTPILTRPISDIQAFYQPWKDLLGSPPEHIGAQILASGLRGRGGAGFPMGQKLEFCRQAPGDVKFIICNADEGDPGAYSDRYLLEHRPHTVLFGMLVSGYVTGAHYGVVYIRGEYPEAVQVVQNAVAELVELGLAGQDILGSGFHFEFKIIQAQGSYICGEETALINSIEGQRPEVRVRPPYPAQRGLFNKPTVVNNVETLAALHYILSEGPDAWKALGTEQSTGIKLVCLDSFFNRPGVYEVEMGTPLKTVIEDLGGGFRVPVKALQIGGPLGGVVPEAAFGKLTVDFESFSEAGFLLGHASVVSIPEGFPMIRYIEHLLDFAAYESCGKCFPCRLGTKRGHEMVRQAAEGEITLDRNLFEDLLTTLQQGSLCAHGGGIPLPVRNILQHFEAELTAFFN
ncbi:NADH-ubiquinone oxidoreductase-F iron-sulfur binding region domain-containing protein [Robiginitalea sp. M366]|uniref:NADH-ubiquinone oxidoreductase-F iron-sulfur binding region domain-containing protein n=1 Tax=Robiginitalea aestuariiviva TaxID=3036903 RepID=UPI00240CF664|nr:NADH-ubiquinone oxidoreductase-F iron-sulfur binding region domain-containing protein [Robiginitalea aestuariiviva]MDG1570977.1 NADH-ubiquinone oxidoreductase-F iron-sulfur binding region domain-containing protein [Robiginitalea aestuariiviva]